LIGALILVVAVIAMGEVARDGRYLNVILGLIIAIVPWFLNGSTVLMNINGMLVGLLVAVLTIPRGVKKETYGLWDHFIK
jgi:predicted branched-subunit amino acid permease